ncbi:major facilitator superfamily domain-containing protein [Lasiosphaeria hispida]|uniref:Major facilitator superfamily domain-containing protein n=1 Tax=Lasiosphaeria hispida TaxID=260671 RepID=A0AAJ0HSL1_9PEZI|nr:major facilitator superfamily domain-containing protein [Lasiosphaeria hispida]
MAKDATVIEVKGASSAKLDGPNKVLSPPSQLSGSEEGGYNSEKNPFADPVTAEHWREVYEKSQYECRHVYNPTLTWTEEEEKTIIRKLDWRICLWACIMFFALQVDRGNLAQAVSDNMLDDLGLNTNDYNDGNSIFRLAFLLAELPSQLLSKKIGPDRWIPIQIVLWSIVATAQCALTGRVSFLCTRALLGVLEGGFIPDIVLWLSYFYTARELPIRLSYFWTSLSVTGIITSLLAFALLHLRGVNGWAGWRWLFLVEGLITLLVGIASFFFMPASAVQTKSWFRPAGWFTDREVGIVVNRILRDDPSKGDMHNRQAITFKLLWEALKDFDLWPLYIIGLIEFIPSTPPTQYITLTLRNLGFSPFTTNLLTIPYNFFHIINLLLITQLSENLNERAYVALLQPLWTLPCLIALRWWPGAVVDKWGTYALVTVLTSYPYAHAILVGWASRNSNNVGVRSVSAAMYNMACQAGSITAAYIYQEQDKPLYKTGNQNLVIINVLVIVVFLSTKFYYVWRNSRRDEIWKGMTEQERKDYVKNTKTVGSRRLDFRFAH